jgi:PPOX class probable F420-dependent enzyme
MTGPSTVESVGDSSYAVVTTYKRDGTAVPTAVWVVRDGDALAFWTVTGSGKVKRIRRDGTVLIGPSDVRGRPTGPPLKGHAVILDAAGGEHVRDLLRRKYGLMGRLTLFFSRLRRGADGTIGIRVTLDPAAGQDG